MFTDYYREYTGERRDKVAAVLSPLAGYYSDLEFAEFSHCFEPNEGFKATHTFPTMMYGVFAPPVNLGELYRVPPHEFDGDRNDFVVLRGDWREEVDGPSGNRVFRHVRDDVVDATAVAGDPRWMNYEIRSRFKVRRFNASNLANVGFFARYIDNDNYYRFSYNKNTNTLRAEQKVNGTLTLLRSIPFTVKVGTWYTLILKVNGPQMTLTINDVIGDVYGPDGVAGALLQYNNRTDTELTIPSASGQPALKTYLRPELTWNGQPGLFAHRTDVMFDRLAVRRIPLAEAGLACSQ